MGKIRQKKAICKFKMTLFYAKRIGQPRAIKVGSWDMVLLSN
jgi:hypothetical protein